MEMTIHSPERRLYNPAALIRRNLDEWEEPYAELDVFGTSSAQQIVDIVDAFCHEHLGSRIRGYIFHSASVGSTHGVRLVDGRDVVIKARPPVESNAQLNHDRKGLEAVFSVMQWLHARSYPCPGPVLGPSVMARGVATVEEYFEPAERGDAFQPACRSSIAAGLAELIELLRSCPVDIRCFRRFDRWDALYPPPHSRLFNFENTSKGAEWIDDLARRARGLEIHEGAPVLGHADWRVEHLRFENGRIAAVYDWDALTFAPETLFVGISAHGFTADWSIPDRRRIPGKDDILGYIADYEQARGRVFSKQERRAVLTTCVYCIAYGARCQHSLDPLKTDWEENTWPFLLRTDGESLLAEAG